MFLWTITRLCASHTCGQSADCALRIPVDNHPIARFAYMWTITRLCASHTYGQSPDCALRIPADNHPIVRFAYLWTITRLCASHTCGQSPDCALRIPVDNHPIVRFAYLCQMIGEELVFFSFLYINHRSAVTHHKVNLLKFPKKTYKLRHPPQGLRKVSSCCGHLSLVETRNMCSPSQARWRVARKTLCTA